MRTMTGFHSVLLAVCDIGERYQSCIEHRLRLAALNCRSITDGKRITFQTSRLRCEAVPLWNDLQNIDLGELSGVHVGPTGKDELVSAQR